MSAADKIAEARRLISHENAALVALADLAEAQAQEIERLRGALRRAYDHVLKDAPDWFEDGSHEQKAMAAESNAARAALGDTP